MGGSNISGEREFERSARKSTRRSAPNRIAWGGLERAGMSPECFEEVGKIRICSKPKRVIEIFIPPYINPPGKFSKGKEFSARGDFITQVNTYLNKHNEVLDPFFYDKVGIYGDPTIEGTLYRRRE